MPASDFSHLQVLDVSADKTAEFKIHQITVNEKTPTLIVAPATDANKPYFNALLKRAGKSARQVKAGKMDASLIEENRDEDRALYPKFVLRGWMDMIDANGKDVKFTPKDAAKFLEALPDWIFDQLRNFCGEASNYSDVMDVEIVAKN